MALHPSHPDPSEHLPLCAHGSSPVHWEWSPGGQEVTFWTRAVGGLHRCSFMPSCCHLQHFPLATNKCTSFLPQSYHFPCGLLLGIKHISYSFLLLTAVGKHNVVSFTFTLKDTSSSANPNMCILGKCRVSEGMLHRIAKAFAGITSCSSLRSF